MAMLLNRKKLLILVLLSITCLVATILGLGFLQTSASEEVTQSWFDFQDEKIEINEDGNIVNANGAFYCADKMPVKENGDVKSVKISYSIQKTTNTTHQLKFVFTGTSIDGYASYQNKLGVEENYLGFALVYGNDNYLNKIMQYGASSGAGNWKNNYYGAFDPISGETHTVEMFFSTSGVWAEIDGKTFLKQNSTDTYYFVKSDNSKYTINDFTIDGEFAVYFGIDGAYSFATTIYGEEHIWKENVPYGLPYNNANFKNVAEQFVTASEDGSVPLTGVCYYYGNLANKDFYSEYEALRARVELSIDSFGEGAIAAVMAHCLFSNEPITDGAYQLVSKYGKQDGPLLDLTLRYVDGNAVTKNALTARVLDCAWRNTAIKTIPEKGKFSVQLDVTVDGATLSINGTQIGGYLEKSTGVRWTLSDFVLEEEIDGEIIKTPQLYFGFVCGDKKYLNAEGGFGPYRVHNIKTEYDADEVPAEVNGFKGKANTLKEEDGKVALYGGDAYSSTVFDNKKTIKGNFEIVSVPENEELAFNVSVKDNKTSKNSGNGLSIKYSKVQEEGKSKLVIGFGVFVDGLYKSLGTKKTNVEMIGKHSFAIIFSQDYYSIVTDGESMFFGFYQTSELSDMSSKIKNDNLLVYYSADSDSEQDIGWKVYLESIELAEKNEYEHISTDVEVFGEKVLNDKIIVSNKTYKVTDKGLAQKGAFILKTPIEVFGRKNVQFLVKIKMEKISSGDSVDVLFSVVEGGSIDTDNDQSFVLTITKNSGNEYNILAKMGSSVAEKTMTADNNEFDVMFGFTQTGSAISVNKRIVLEGDLTKGMFVSSLGQNGYFSMITTNNSDINQQLEVNVTAPVHYEGDVINEVENEKQPSNSNEGDVVNVPEKQGCGSNIEHTGIYVLVIAFVLMAVIIRRKNKNEKNN